jgi:hypothetical protein
VSAIRISIRKAQATLPQLHSDYSQAATIEMAGFMEFDSDNLCKSKMLETALPVT